MSEPNHQQDDDSLLSPSFMRELESLRRRLAVRPRSGATGEAPASRRGSSAEFLEHRPYSPGDDLRRVDWLAFARTGEPVLKLFRADEDVVVRLLVDASRSLECGSPSKLDVAKRTAAALGYVALAASERAQVAVAGDGLAAVREPRRGRHAVPALLRELDAIAVLDRADLAKAVDGTLARSRRPGMLVVLSDFLDGGPFADALLRAAASGHDVAMIQVLAPEETDPPWDGDLALEDVETHDVVEVTLDDRARAAYLARLHGLYDVLRDVARRARGTYVRVGTAQPLIEAARRFVQRAVD
jgi:uncharacterized protein (DUF58 family)